MNTHDLVAPLSGYICTEEVSRVYLPMIISLEPDKGHVGRYLSKLQEEFDEVIVPGVISDKLKGMLIRRHFRLEQEWSPEFEELVGCYVWRKAKH